MRKKQLMGRKVRSAWGQRIYVKCKQIVEPVFGQIKGKRVAFVSSCFVGWRTSRVNGK